MQYKTTILIAVFLLVTGLARLKAQESMSAAGGNAAGNGGSASYSVGQVVYQTHTETIGSVTEGIQQPYEITVVTATEEINGITLSVSAYPNPAKDHLILSIEDKFKTNDDLAPMSYQLYDMNGKLLKQSRITSNKTSIGMSSLIPGNYLVKVIQSNREVKTFKIIKK